MIPGVWVIAVQSNRIAGSALLRWAVTVGNREVVLAADNLNPTVLVIEDDQAISDIVTRVLSNEGFKTHAAYDGAQGLDAYQMTLLDLIILDVKMPVMDGWETLTRLRRTSEVPVIMLTVYSAKQDIIKGLELGADDYLVKPFGIRELIARVNAVLRRTTLVM